MVEVTVVKTIAANVDSVWAVLDESDHVMTHFLLQFTDFIEQKADCPYTLHSKHLQPFLIQRE